MKVAELWTRLTSNQLAIVARVRIQSHARPADGARHTAHSRPNQPRPQILHRTIPLQRVAVPTKQLQVVQMISPALRPRNDVVHRQMLRQEMRPTPIAVPALSAVKHHLRLAQRRSRFTVRPLRNIRPRDSLNTTHQPKLIPSPLLNQLHRHWRQINPDPLSVQPLRRDASRRTPAERVCTMLVVISFSVRRQRPCTRQGGNPQRITPTTNTKSQKSPIKSHQSQFRQQPPSPQHPLPQQPSPLPRAISLPLPGGD